MGHGRSRTTTTVRLGWSVGATAATTGTTTANVDINQCGRLESTAATVEKPEKRVEQSTTATTTHATTTSATTSFWSGQWMGCTTTTTTATATTAPEQLEWQ